VQFQSLDDDSRLQRRKTLVFVFNRLRPRNVKLTVKSPLQTVNTLGKSFA